MDPAHLSVIKLVINNIRQLNHISKQFLPPEQFLGSKCTKIDLDQDPDPTMENTAAFQRDCFAMRKKELALGGKLDASYQLKLFKHW